MPEQDGDQPARLPDLEVATFFLTTDPQSARTVVCDTLTLSTRRCGGYCFTARKAYFRPDFCGYRPIASKAAQFNPTCATQTRMIGLDGHARFPKKNTLLHVRRSYPPNWPLQAVDSAQLNRYIQGWGDEP